MITVTLYGITIYRGFNFDYAMRIARKMKTVIGHDRRVEHTVAVYAN